MLNQRLVLFIIAIVLFLQFNKVENLDTTVLAEENIDIDALIQQQTERVYAKMGNKVPQAQVPSVNNLVNAAIKGDDLTSSINTLVAEAIKNAGSKNNVVKVDTDGEEINNLNVNGEPNVETNQEEEGGGMNISLVLFIIISVLIITKK